MTEIPPFDCGQPNPDQSATPAADPATVIPITVCPPIQLVPQVPPSEDEIRRLRWPDDVPIKGVHVLIGVPCLWGALLVVSLGVGVAFAGIMSLSGKGELSTALLAVALVADAGLTVGFLVVLLGMNHRSGFFSSYRLWGGSIGWIASALVVGVVLATGYQAISRTVWPYDKMEDGFNLLDGQLIDLLLFTIVGLVAAVVEELYYRGLI